MGDSVAGPKARVIIQADMKWMKGDLTTSAEILSIALLQRQLDGAAAYLRAGAFEVTLKDDATEDLACLVRRDISVDGYLPATSKVVVLLSSTCRFELDA